MLNLLSRALTGMVLDRDARDAMREAGGLASTIQGSADMRAVIQQLAATRPAIGSTPLTSPSSLPATSPANPLADPVVMANAAALQAALLTEILAQARSMSTMPGETVTVPSPNADGRFEPTLAPPRVARPAPPPTSNMAGTLQAAILAQALATSRVTMPGGLTASAPVRAPMTAPQPAVPAAPPPAAHRPAPGRRLSPTERAQLIQNALKVHSAKQTILANLSDEQRAKLTELATKLLDPDSRAGQA